MRVARSGSASTSHLTRDHSPRPNVVGAYLIVSGHTDKSAAQAPGISVNTVGTHLRSVYSKFGVQSRVQLTNALRERGEL